MIKRKILLIGPIGDFGGRELEAGFIAKTLMSDYEVSICSTVDFTDKSQLFDFVKKGQVTSLKELAFINNFILRVTSFFSFLKNNRKYPMSFYVTNKFNKRYFNLDDKINNQIIKEIGNNDLILICAQLSSSYMKEIIDYSHLKNKTILFRTTGTIREVSKDKFKLLKKVTKFIHHSEANAANLNSQILLPYVIIDQCAFNESSLLELNISNNKNLVFGYLGRLSREKGILQFLQKVSLDNLNLIIAGDGNLKENVVQIIKNNPTIQYIGKIKHNSLIDFFNKIDVIIIPSIEESGPLVALEAMAAGKLIVSTNVGAMKERLVGVNSYWFDINDIEEKIQESINSILEIDSEQFLEKRNILRNLYIEKFSMKIIESKYLKLILKHI